MIAERGNALAMHAYHITMAGLVFDIAGAFLLSVEAIKLENLHRLRERAIRLFNWSLGMQKYGPPLWAAGAIVVATLLVLWMPAPSDKHRPGLAFVGIGMLSVLLAWFGAIVWLFLLYGVFNGLQYIEAKTARGAIGIAGFGLLFTGFVLQMIGTYFSAT